MPGHLTDEQLGELLTESPGGSAGAREHLAVCAACRDEHERLDSFLAEYARALRAEGTRPAAFWEGQQRSIAAQREARGASRRMVWATAVATAVFAVALLLEQGPSPAPVAETDPDQALLAEVQVSVERDLPRALEPAALLAAEMARAAKAESQRPKGMKGEQR